MRELVQLPEEDRVHLDLAHRRPGLQPHVGQRPLGRLAVARVGHGRRVGHRTGDRRHLGGIGAPGDMGRDGGGVEHDLLVEGGSLVGGQRAPVGHGGIPVVALGRMVRAADVVERDLVGGDQAGPGAALDRHVAQGHAALHGEATDGRTPVLDDVADATAGADGADDGQRHVLRRDPGRQVPLDRDRHGLRPHLGEGLGGQDVLDLAGPHAERDGTEGAVGRGVAVTAHDGHPGLGPALLGSDDVDDALVRVTHGEAGDAELGGVVVEYLQLLGRDRVLDRLVDVLGGHVVVGGGHGQVGPADAPPGQAEAVEGLGRGDLVDEVEIDEEEVGLALGRMHHVGVPDLLDDGARSHQRVTATMCTFNMPPGRLVLDRLTGAVADQDLPQGRAGRDDLEISLALLDGADEEPLRLVLVVPVVAQGDRAAQRDRPVVGSAVVDQLDVLEHGLELADAGLHLSLEVLGRVVVAVLREVAEGPGRLDLLGDLHPAPRGQILQLGHQPVVGGLGQLRGFCLVGGNVRHGESFGRRACGGAGHGVGPTRVSGSAWALVPGPGIVDGGSPVARD